MKPEAVPILDAVPQLLAVTDRDREEQVSLQESVKRPQKTSLALMDCLRTISAMASAVGSAAEEVSSAVEVEDNEVKDVLW